MMNRKYKIAILNSHPIQYFAPLYRQLNSIGAIDLTVFYYSDIGLKSYYDEGFKKEIQWDTDLTKGYKYKILTNLRRESKLKGFFNLVNTSLYRELKSGEFDAVIIHGTNYFTDVLAIFCCRLLGIKIFLRRSIHLQLRRSRSTSKERVISFLTKMCDGCLSISERNTAYFLKMGVDKTKIYNIPHVVNNSHFIKESKLSPAEKTSVKERYNLPADNKIILFASKVFKRKRPKDLLYAFEKLKNNKAFLVFVGEGEQLGELKELVAIKNLKNVIFLGFVNQSELPKLYAISDIFVLPSEQEPWGLVINEAMCAGLPVVTTHEIGAVPEIVKHELNGLIYDAGNIDQLTTHLERLVSDEELRVRMGKNGFNLIREYDYDLFSKRLVSILDEVIENR